MSWQLWLRRLNETYARRRRQGQGAAARRRRPPTPGVELLEDRAVPAVLSTFLTTEHVDLNVGYTGGTSGVWSIQPRNNDEVPAVSYAPDEALLYVGTPALQTRPGGAAFDFIGVAAGANFYQLPQSQNPDLLYLGGAAQGLNALDFDRYNPASESKDRVSGLGRWIKVSLVSVQHFTPDGQPGAGSFSVWQSEDTGPNVFIASYNDNVANPNGSGLDATDGVSAGDALWMIAGGHFHFNWGFTQKGRYEITVKLSGYLDDGNTTSLGQFVESQPIKLYFSVGSVGQLEFDAASYSVNENAGTASVKVRRAGGSDGRITAQFTTTGGSATAGADFTDASGTLTFNDQEIEKTVTIPIVNDSADEADETVNLALSNPGPSSIASYVANVDGSSVLGSPTAATLTIIDNDVPNTPPTISDIANQVSDEDVPKTVNFTIGDAETPASDLTVTATSSNTTLVPNANLVPGGSGANRTLTITPAANLSGAATITIKVRDAGGAEATDTFDFLFNAVNDVPVANPQSVSTNEDTARSITLTGSDVESSVTYAVVTGPSHGTLSGTVSNLTYTPALNYHGSDSFTFKVNDGTLDSSAATISITVNAVNDPTTAAADAYLVGTGHLLFGNVLANDSDADGALTASLAAAADHGSVALAADGSFTYAPGPTFAGSDAFTYRASDGNVTTDPVTVTIAAAGPQDFEAIITVGHTDIGIAYEDGWDLHIHDEENDAEYEPDAALLYIGPQAETTRLPGPAFDFIGVGAGATFWQLPHSPPHPELLTLGFGTEEIADSVFQDDQVRLRLKAVNGPGRFSVWRSTDSGPEVFMATSDGITAADLFTGLAGGHEDMNFGFTARGRYEVTFQAWGYLDDGDNLPDFSEDVTYFFSVDSLGRLQFAAPTYAVTEGGAVTVTVERVGGNDGPLTVNYAAAGGTAAAGSDYVPFGGTLTFADGQTSRTFQIAALHDSGAEGTETIALALTVPAGSPAVLGDPAIAEASITNATGLRVTSFVVKRSGGQNGPIRSLRLRFSEDTNVRSLIKSGKIRGTVQLVGPRGRVVLSTDRFDYNPRTRMLTMDLKGNTGGSSLLGNGRYELRLRTSRILTANGAQSLIDDDGQPDGLLRYRFRG